MTDLKTNDLKSIAQFRLDFDRFSFRVALVCIGIALFMVFLDAFVNYNELSDIGAIQRLCNITREDSLASWYGTTLTFMVGLTLWLIALILIKTHAPKKRRTGWIGLAVFFTYMAIDDGAMIHERLGTAFEEISGEGSKIIGLFPSYHWQQLFIPLFLVLGFYFLFFLKSEIKQKHLRRLLIIALICVVTAIAIDFFEGLEPDHRLNLHSWLEDVLGLDSEPVLHFSKSIEEFIEMLGMTLFWVVFLRYLGNITQKGLMLTSVKEES
ncbi:hypothetical protein ACFLT9_05585 [Acidobacteriota bacterium]